MREPASPAAAPIRQKIKMDAPKIKTSANAVKQPVRAMERAKAKAILDARKSTAATRTTARTAKIGGRAAEGTARELGAAISRALKASLEGLKALASMIAAGDGVALVVVLVICLVALLLATPFGLFLAPEHSDSGSTSAWATDAMAWAVGVGIINGTRDANGTANLNPQGNASRAQVTAMTERFCQKTAK